MDIMGNMMHALQNGNAITENQNALCETFNQESVNLITETMEKTLMGISPKPMKQTQMPAETIQLQSTEFFL